MRSQCLCVQGGPSRSQLADIWNVLLQFPLSEDDVLARLPLIPIVDGRLVRIHYRHTVLAMPQPSNIPEHAPSPPNTEEGCTSASLEEPWDWVLPMLTYLKVPVLDPHFGVCSSIVGPKPVVEGELVGRLLLRLLRGVLTCSEPGISIKVRGRLIPGVCQLCM